MERLLLFERAHRRVELLKIHLHDEDLDGERRAHATCTALLVAHLLEEDHKLFNALDVFALQVFVQQKLPRLLLSELVQKLKEVAGRLNLQFDLELQSLHKRHHLVNLVKQRLPELALKTLLDRAWA